MYTLEGKIPRLLVLLGFCLVLGGIFALGGIALCKPIFNTDINDITSLISDLEQAESIVILKFLQLLNTLGLFVVPGILFSLIFIKQPIQELKVGHKLSSVNIFLVFILMYSLLPAMNWLVEWNQNLDLPEAFSSLENWLKSKEENAMELTHAFLKMENTSDLWVNLVLIAVLPAIGEELIFRGLVQKIINKNLSSPHLGIWISAILFSALHMQFYGFFPRMFLGAFFGYLYVWGKSLWYPILAHFINNATAVLIAYKLGIEGMEKQFDTLGASDDTFVYSILGSLIFAFFLFRFYQRNKSA